MKFEIKNLNKSINDIMRTIGYRPAYFSRLQSNRGSSMTESSGQNEDEISIVRQLGRNDYPRFHLYITKNDREFSFNIHLDQKKPSYPARIGYAKDVAGGEGYHAHSGEYDGDLVENEVERIKKILN